ncbi:hypothetical protein VOLCADRAFT_62922, partial [Volvox carteri f. nagariensis]
GMAVCDVYSAIQEFLQVQTCRAQLYSRFQDGFKTFIRTRHEGPYKALLSELTLAFNDCSKKVIGLESALQEMGRADLAATLRTVQESERDKLRLTLTLQALKQAAAFRTFSWQQQRQRKGDQHQQQGGGEDSGWYGYSTELYEDEDGDALALLDPLEAAARHGGGCAHGHGHGHGSSNGNGHVHGHGPTEAPPASAGSTGVLPSATTYTTASLAVSEAAGGPGGGPAGSSSGCGGSGCGGAVPEPTRREFQAAVKEAMQDLDACIQTINEAIGELSSEMRPLSGGDTPG